MLTAMCKLHCAEGAEYKAVQTPISNIYLSTDSHTHVHRRKLRLCRRSSTAQGRQSLAFRVTSSALL